MAKKSKTQRAKASARRAEKKVQASVEEIVEEVVEEGEPKRKLIGRKDKAEEAAPAKSSEKKVVKAEKKEGGTMSRMRNFIKEVRSELRRVTWPSRQDVIRWSGVVVVALVFFSLYVFVLDNWIVTPLLLAISSLGA